MTFGEKLRDSRKALSLTQKQLADKIGAKHNSVSDWENDKNKPDPDTIELICGVLNISPDYLLGVNSDSLSAFEKELIKKYRSLDDRSKKMVDYILNVGTEFSIIIEQSKAEKEQINKRLIAYEQTIKKYNQEKLNNYKTSVYPSMVAESSDFYSVNAARPVTDEKVTEEMKKHDDDIMDDDNF